jgi:DNA ligase-1
VITKPMLAVDAADISKLVYPVLASPKLDGIRCLKVGGQALSRKFKPIPNNFIRDWIENRLPDGVDGELMVGKDFQQCQSGVMSIHGEPDFTFMVFDLVTDVSVPFRTRYSQLCTYIGAQQFNPAQRVQLVPHVLCNSLEELIKFEVSCVSAGYEGAMVRSVAGPYKNGRSTLREGYLLKITRWIDSEAIILSVHEQFTNTNEAKTDELGHTKRSSHKAVMVPADTLGEFHVRDVTTGLEFRVGTGEGLTKELRKTIWDARDEYVGKIITYKYQPHGVKELPRFPVFKGFRHSDDMSE